MGFTRVATSKKLDKYAIILEIGKKEIKLSHADILKPQTADKIATAIAKLAEKEDVILPAIFLHVNRDDSIALATGAAPDVWPEDEVV